MCARVTTAGAGAAPRGRVRILLTLENFEVWRSVLVQLHDRGDVAAAVALREAEANKKKNVIRGGDTRTAMVSTGRSDRSESEASLRAQCHPDS